MTIFKYSNELINMFPSLYDEVDNLFVEKIVAYMINSKYRKTVYLKYWLKDQITDPDPILFKIRDEISIAKDDPDATMINILRYVRGRLTYKGDSAKWNMDEYWATAAEIVAGGWEDDCDGGAILMYVLARLCGIPANRLLVWCGDVTGGGHACLMYKPKNYPLNWAMIDWCYWPNESTIGRRSLFTLSENKLYEYPNVGAFNWADKTQGNYQKTWFAFNENRSYLSFERNSY